MADRIGIIGAGIMGGAMTRRLIDRGFSVTVCDIDSAKVAGLVVIGATAAANAREVADQAEIVFASLPSPAASLAVAREVSGADRLRVYLETSTIGSEAVVQVAELVSGDGVDVVDAPVSGGAFAVEEGRLTLFLSGPPPAIDRAAPALDALSSVAFRLGDEVGRGQLCKVINNGVGMAGLVAACEGLAVAAAAGIDAKTMIDVLNAGSGSSWATARLLPNTLLAGQPSGAIAITAKDLGLYLVEAQRYAAVAPVATDLLRSLEAAIAHGDPRRDTTELLAYFTDLARKRR